MKVEMFFFRGGKHGLFLDMGRQKFYGFIEYYYQRLVQNDDKEAIVDPEIIEGLPGLCLFVADLLFLRPIFMCH